MKIAIKVLTLVLALVMMTTPLMAYNLHAQLITPGANYTIVYSGLPAGYTQNTNGQLVVPNTAHVGDTFTVEIHLVNATSGPNTNNLGVGGLEVHLDFSALLPFAVPTTLTDNLGKAGGVLNTPVLEGITGGIYESDGVTLVPSAPFTGGVQYIVAGAGSATSPWTGADGIIATIQFSVIKVPNNIAYSSDPVCPLTFTFVSLADSTAAAINVGDMDAASVTFTRTVFVAPPNPYLTISPASQTGATTLGSPVNYVVSILTDPFWDVAGFDIVLHWNSTLLTYVGWTDGTFLSQHGDTEFNITITSGTPIDTVEIIETKLTDAGASGGASAMPLFTLNLAVNYVGTSYPALTCPITFVSTDLASWAHPEIAIAPWYGAITAVDMPYATTGTAGDGTHQRGPDASYTAPVIPPGANIDLYDQYPAPFGGQGQMEASDSFAPQAEVCLYANVTYGGDRISNKLVAFEIDNALGQKVTILQNYTDANGVATVCFRLPMSDTYVGGTTGNESNYDPAIFGLWIATATVEVDQQNFTDTMPFLVGWLVQVLNVQSMQTSYSKYAGVPMSFSMDVLCIHQQPLNVLLSVDTYDVQGYPIGETSFWVTLSAGSATETYNGTSYTNMVVPVVTAYGTMPNGGTYYGYGSLNSSGLSWMNEPYQKETVSGNILQGIPSWTRVGIASVVGYALTALPVNGGTPYGPQSNVDGTTTTFTITKY